MRGSDPPVFSDIGKRTIAIVVVENAFAVPEIKIRGIRHRHSRRRPRPCRSRR